MSSTRKLTLNTETLVRLNQGTAMAWSGSIRPAPIGTLVSCTSTK